MKWNTFVYARGVQRTDGYKMRVQPDEFPVSVIQGCQTFFNVRSVNEKRGSWKELFESDPLAWQKSFMFTIQPKYNSCLLIRAVKVESENGEMLVDFENRDVWSLEGVWCPYEQLNLIFASLPSILMWFASQKHSLRYCFSGRSDCTIDVGDDFYYNPYSDSAVLPQCAFSTVGEMSALNMLAQKIKFSSEPFSFAFGPLSDMIMNKCAGVYGIKTAFSTLDPSSLGVLGDDPFMSIEKARLVEQVTDTELKTYVLQSCTEQSGKKERNFRWRIAERSAFAGDKEVLSSSPVPFDDERGLNFIRLKAEAEAVRIFARNMQWKTEQQSSDERIIYTFLKEERKK